MQGRIKKMTSRGFGFIETESEVDFFFHYTDYNGNWKVLLSKWISGSIILVKFEQDTENEKGPKAMHVVVEDYLQPPI